jgi:hypothetical protein
MPTELDKHTTSRLYLSMKWDIEFTDEFGSWWDDLSEVEQNSIDVSVGLLEALGPNLKHPHYQK